MKTRFAPSPTGYLHYGNIRTALFNFLLAQKHGGKLLLRIEDTDVERSREEYVEALLADFAWLGVSYDDDLVRQSDRHAIYDNYYQYLQSENLAYPCFCSEMKLKMVRKQQLASGLPPRYNGECRNLAADQVQRRLDAGEGATLRFKVPRDTLVEFNDLCKGRQQFQTNDIGDFIIRRQNGSASFMFCNAIDDSKLGVTHALRGEDHLTNTPRQLLILRALGLAQPEYGHFPLIVGSDNAPLSKRNGSVTARDLRAQGFCPIAIVNYLARLGHYYADNELLSMEGLANKFSLKSINNSPAKHDNSHLKHWQKEAVLKYSAKEVWQWLEPELQQHTTEIPTADREKFATLVQSNILLPSDAVPWVAILYAEQLSYAEDMATVQEVLLQAGTKFFTAAIEYINQQQELDYRQLTKHLTEQTGLKGKALFLPLRLILTGQRYGPELVKVIELLPKSRVLARFQQASAMVTNVKDL